MTTLPTREEFDALSKKLAMLEKIADKSKLARMMPQEALGTEIRIPLYRATLTDEPQLVTSWRMLSNESRVTRFGAEADQVVEITLHQDSIANKPDLRGIKMQLGKAQQAGDASRIAELTEKIEAAEKEYSNIIELQLEDFGRVITSEAVKVEATENRGGLVFFSFNWKGKEYKLAHTFVNP